MSTAMSTDIATPSPGRVPTAVLAATAAVAAAVVVGYLPSIVQLVHTWWSEPSYSHGFLVVPIAAAILYQRWDRLDRSRLRPNPLGWVGVVGLLIVRAWLYEWNEPWGEQATIPLMAASLALAFGGWRLVWWALPGLLFLLLMLPLPARVNNMMAAPLQTVATLASTAVLQTTQLPVLAEGNVIIVGTEHLEVARACNGLSMLLSFVTLIVAVVMLANDRPLWERIVLLLSTVPIAIAANVLRIVVTGWCYYLFTSPATVHSGFGTTTVGELGHDAAGWGMMPIALLMVWLELKLLSWLVVSVEVNRAAVVRLPVQAAPRLVKK